MGDNDCSYDSLSSPSLISDDSDLENSQDPLSLDFKDDSKYYASASTLPDDISASNVNLTSHKVDDILSEGPNYNEQENTFDCKSEVLSAIPSSFVQDYNSRDSSGFTIQDILGLQQNYNPNNEQDTLDGRYYPLSAYETISNTSNSYTPVLEEVSPEPGPDKNNDIFERTKVGNESPSFYNGYADGSLRFNQSNFNKNEGCVEDSSRHVGTLHQSNFSNQVSTCNSLIWSGFTCCYRN